MSLVIVIDIPLARHALPATVRMSKDVLMVSAAVRNRFIQITLDAFDKICCWSKMWGSQQTAYKEQYVSSGFLR